MNRVMVAAQLGIVSVAVNFYLHVGILVSFANCNAASRVSINARSGD
jgi:hypothetical protein